jgi:predicted Rossmann fold nucleotide-binding protein DprA/Smf involved in DNA uptake
MTDLHNHIALSLLPSWSWLHAAERLRAGDTAAAALRHLLDRHWRDDANKAATLQTRATAAIRRAEERGIAAVPWSDARYPAALTTIADPPPIL